MRQVPISLFANWDTFRPPTYAGPVNVTACLSPKLGSPFPRGRRVIASPEHTGNTYTVSRFPQAAFTPSPALRAQAGALGAVWESSSEGRAAGRKAKPRGATVVATGGSSRTDPQALMSRPRACSRVARA